MGERPGTADLQLPPDFETNDGVARIGSESDAGGRSLKVRVTTLDEVLGDAPVGVLKLDVEGFEYQALEGCERILRDWHPVIVSEFSPGMMKGMSDADGPAYLRRIIRHGYDLSVIAPDGSLLPAGARWETVMEIHGTRGTDHVDLVATPA